MSEKTDRGWHNRHRRENLCDTEERTGTEFISVQAWAPSSERHAVRVCVCVCIHL